MKCRNRLLCLKGTTLKSLELSTSCYILVHGQNVFVIRPSEDLQQVRWVVYGCMSNIHLVYNIKALMTKRELMKDHKLCNERSDRLLSRKKNTTRVSSEGSWLLAERACRIFVSLVLACQGLAWSLRVVSRCP